MALLLKIVSFSNIVTGVLAFLLQIFELILFRTATGLREPDLVSVGIWGGSFLVLFGALLLTDRFRDRAAIQGLAVYSLSIGLTMIGLYSWSINRYQYFVADCNRIFINNVRLCSRVALDSFLIICGIVAFGINTMVALLASTLASS